MDGYVFDKKTLLFNWRGGTFNVTKSVVLNEYTKLPKETPDHRAKGIDDASVHEIPLFVEKLAFPPLETVTNFPFPCVIASQTGENPGPGSPGPVVDVHEIPSEEYIEIKPTATKYPSPYVTPYQSSKGTEEHAVHDIPFDEYIATPPKPTATKVPLPYVTLFHPECGEGEARLHDIPSDEYIESA
jgi:hypothetical protein